MLYEKFINNGRMQLAAGIGAADTDLSITSNIDGADAFGSGYFTRATISAEGISAVEVIYITTLDAVAGSLKVIRGREQTVAQAWPAGAVLECRVTAGMLDQLAASTLIDCYNLQSISIAYGENIKATNPKTDAYELIPNSWAIGGSPVIPESGNNYWIPICRSVEGVGASISVELGVPPDFDPAATYYPGAVVRDPNPPHGIYLRSNWVVPGQEIQPLDAPDGGGGRPPPWGKVTPDADGGILRAYLEAGYDDTDAWFYPSEIGFICDQHSATSTPTVSVGEVDSAGELVSLTNLVNAAPLTAIDGAHQRIVLATHIKQGVKGLIFSIDTAAAGGSFKGRFYWKGLFISSNTAAGWPTEPSPPDGVV